MNHHNKLLVDTAFSVLCGLETFQIFRDKLPPDLRKYDDTQVDTSRWKGIKAWADWWKRPHVLKKLSKAYSLLPSEEWEDLPGTNNPVESINRQSVLQNVKSVSLKPLVEHFYLEDRRQAILQLAKTANITISYHTKKRRRRYRPAKPPEKQVNCVPLPSHQERGQLEPESVWNFTPMKIVRRLLGTKEVIASRAT